MDSMRPIIPVILSGGSGTRLWPLSRSMRPKQFINLVGEDSLFQKTLLRLSEIPDVMAPVVVCNNEHRFMVAEQMQELDLAHHCIVLEPVARNTAPAVTVAALKLAQSAETQNAIMMVLPADHLVADEGAFLNAIEIARAAAAEDALVTFGITPHRPATEYGYIKTTDGVKAPAVSVEKFVEKPNRETAESYLAEGNYLWNSGMFMFTPEAFIGEIKRYGAEVYQYSDNALQGASEDLDFLRLSESDYAECPNISIDYAVMEPSDKVKVVPLNAGWSDIGSWTSLWESGNKDGSGNVTHGDVVLESVNNSYIHAENRLVAALGVVDLIVVETHDGILVTSKRHDQDIKKIVERLKAADRPETELHRKAFRPWGNYDCLDSGDRFQVKRIMVKSGECTSMQKHYHRAEHWIVVSGTAEVTCGERTFMLPENEAAYIPLGEKHRLRNPGKVPLEIIEVQSGAYLGEDDIERFDDEYGRS